MTNTPHPIACTLSSDEYRTRLAEIAALAARSLRHHEYRGDQLELRYAPDAADQVREMVRQESACCAFLRFDIQQAADEFRVVVTAPDAARDALPSPRCTGRH